jgi:DNA-binding GntR family transcriptional regulator
MSGPEEPSAFALPPTRREAVLRQIRDEILSGVLPAGTVLKDAEVASRLGVSITPVREAIAQLAAEGLIDIAPNRTRRVTEVTQKNALELIDVMTVLACAGFEWGVPNLGPAQLERMRVRLDEFIDNLRVGNITAASAAGADFSTIVILASCNRELQTHVDLVVARTLRLVANSAGQDIWDVWVTGYRETLEHLEADRPAEAVDRYRQIYVDYRARVEHMLFDPPVDNS